MSTQVISEDTVSFESNLTPAFSTITGRAYEVGCPYLGESAICRASFSSLVPTVDSRKAFCLNEDYDNCPIFLAKILRRR